MSVKDIEKAIAELPRQEFVELMSWLQEHHHDLWDKQIEDDLAAGRLDGLLSEVEKEYDAGLAQPL
jgi:hypothetical protein